MKKIDYAILLVIQLCVILWVARYQTIPGNIDADYYYMGGLRLAQGHGFTENYIWNYFNEPKALPQPSNAYWMPLASILTALGMWFTGQQTFASGRLVFLLLAILIPPLTTALSYRIIPRRDLAMFSGLLAICSGFYLPYLPITENYSPFMVLGALYFLSLGGDKKLLYFVLGILSGLMSLARSDGILWLFLTFLVITMDFFWDKTPLLSKPKLASASKSLVLAVSGFLLIMLPWYLRNITVFGAPMSSATRRALWLTEYYQTFTFHADQLSYANWLASGWAAILTARLSAIQRIFSNIVNVQSAIILLPFIMIGAWRLRHNFQVRLGLVAWALLIFVFAIIFPFASERGTYIHAVAALQPLVWMLAAVGFDFLLQHVGRLKIFQLTRIPLILQAVFIFMMALISYSSVNALVLANGWQRGELTYPKVEAFLKQQNISSAEPVMVVNPPGYTMMTERSAVMFPYGGEESILAVAKQLGARYILLKADPVNPNAQFNTLYNNPTLYSSIQMVGQVDDVRIFKVIAAP